MARDQRCLLGLLAIFSVGCGSAGEGSAGSSSPSCASGQCGTPVGPNCSEFPLNISTNTTIARGCYFSHGSPSIAKDVHLTLAPGVTVAFADGTGLSLHDGQMLVAEGNAQDPVILTGISHRRGAWRGITIENSTQKNRLQYLTIEYAGSESAALDVTASVLDLEHSVIRESASLAMSMTLPPTDFAVFRNNTFSHNAEGLFVDAQTLMDLDALSTYSGNDRDGIELFNLSGGWPITLHSLGVPYRAMPLVRRGGCHD